MFGFVLSRLERVAVDLEAAVREEDERVVRGAQEGGAVAEPGERLGGRNDGSGRRRRKRLRGRRRQRNGDPRGRWRRRRHRCHLRGRCRRSGRGGGGVPAPGGTGICAKAAEESSETRAKAAVLGLVVMRPHVTQFLLQERGVNVKSPETRPLRASNGVARRFSGASAACRRLQLQRGQTLNCLGEAGLVGAHREADEAFAATRRSRSPASRPRPPR